MKYIGTLYKYSRTLYKIHWTLWFHIKKAYWSYKIHWDPTLKLNFYREKLNWSHIKIEIL